MALERWFERDPFTELDRLQRDFDRWFSAARPSFGRGTSLHRAGVYPALNVYDDGESLIVRAELAGVDPQGLDVTVTGDTLTLHGERPAPKNSDKVSYHRQERDHGRFQRAMTLPEPVNSAKVVATYTDGVLELRLPRAESAKPRRVEIKS